MKKAVIKTGGKQYIVTVGQEIEVELLPESNKNASFTPLLVIDNDKVAIGKPELKEYKVSANITEASIKAPKVTAIRFKAKKRVKKIRGHRQNLTKIKIIKIDKSTK